MKHLAKKAKAVVLCLVMAVSMASCKDNVEVSVNREALHRQQSDSLFRCLEGYIECCEHESIIATSLAIQKDEHYFVMAVMNERAQALNRLDSLLGTSYADDKYEGLYKNYRDETKDMASSELTFLAFLYSEFMNNTFILEGHLPDSIEDKLLRMSILIDRLMDDPPRIDEP